jgi:hypothetical protein
MEENTKFNPETKAKIERLCKKRGHLFTFYYVGEREYLTRTSGKTKEQHDITVKEEIKKLQTSK